MKSPCNLSEFARLVGISQQQITVHVRNGLPVDGDGMIDPEAGRQWMADNLDTLRRETAKAGREKGVSRADIFSGAPGGEKVSGAQTPFTRVASGPAYRGGPRVAKGPIAPKKRGGARVTGKLESVASLRGRKLEAEGRLLDVELKRKTGMVIDRAEAERVVFGRARFERDAWIGWSAKTAAQLAAEAGGDPVAMFAALDRMVRQHLAELADTPVEL